MSSADSSHKINFYQIIFQKYHLCQKDWNQIRPDLLSGLIWFQTVCKVYQQMILAGKVLNNDIFCAIDQNMAGWILVPLSRIWLNLYTVTVNSEIFMSFLFSGNAADA